MSQSSLPRVYSVSRDVTKISVFRGRKFDIVTQIRNIPGRWYQGVVRVSSRLIELFAARLFGYFEFKMCGDGYGFRDLGPVSNH